MSGVISDFILSLASSTLFQSHLWFSRSHPSALPGSFLGSHPAGEHRVRYQKVCFKTSKSLQNKPFECRELGKRFIQELWFALLYRYLRWGTHIPGVVFRNSLVHVCAVWSVDQYSRGGVTGNRNMIQIGRRKCKWLTKQNFGMNDSLIRWRLCSTSGFSPFTAELLSATVKNNDSMLWQTALLQ